MIKLPCLSIARQEALRQPSAAGSHGLMRGVFWGARSTAADGPAPPVEEAEIARMRAAAPKYGIERADVDV